MDYPYPYIGYLPFKGTPSSWEKTKISFTKIKKKNENHVTKNHCYKNNSVIKIRYKK